MRDGTPRRGTRASGATSNGETGETITGGAHIAFHVAQRSTFCAVADRRGFVLTTHRKMTFVERAEMKPAMQFAKKIPTSCTGGFRIAGASLVLATIVFQTVEEVIRAEAAGARAADHESLKRRAPSMKSRVLDRRGGCRRGIVGGAHQLLLAGRHRSVDVDDFKYRV